jgi:hypothetical protein
VIAGAIWMIEEQKQGLLEPEDLDHDFVLDVCRPISAGGGGARRLDAAQGSRCAFRAHLDGPIPGSSGISGDVIQQRSLSVRGTCASLIGPIDTAVLDRQRGFTLKPCSSFSARAPSHTFTAVPCAAVITTADRGIDSFVVAAYHRAEGADRLQRRIERDRAVARTVVVASQFALTASVRHGRPRCSGGRACGNGAGHRP